MSGTAYSGIQFIGQILNKIISFDTCQTGKKTYWLLPKKNAVGSSNLTDNIEDFNQTVHESIRLSTLNGGTPDIVVVVNEVSGRITSDREDLCHIGRGNEVGKGDAIVF